MGLADVQAHHAALLALLGQYPAVFTAGFFGVYVLVAMCSLPFATLLTLLAGSLFGFWQGLLLVSFASSIGATLAMLTSRYVLKPRLERFFYQRYHRYWQLINQGMAQDGALYLFALRLTPLVPFVVINVVLGLTQLSVRTFYWVSQIGMLPLTALYVQAGVQLGQVRTLSDIASPKLLGWLVLAGFAPLIFKKLWQAWQNRRQARRKVPHKSSRKVPRKSRLAK